MIRDGSPVVLPSTYGRDGDALYVHGFTRASAALTSEVSIVVTLLDGIVYTHAATHFPITTAVP